MRSAARHGFSLLEVMIALAILVVSMAILVETQSGAAFLTKEAERIVTATDLAALKFDEAMLVVEEDGFQLGDISESGDFSDLGDEAMDLEFGQELEDYHWEWWVSEIDFELAADLVGAAGELQSSGVLGGGGETPTSDLGGGAGGLGALGGLVSSDMLTMMISPYIREVRVRVWWGEDSDEAEEDGTEVVLVGHVINPSGQIIANPAGAAVDGASAGGGAQ
jgi:prepilin-type N-terminal cleavage/methylation domain-containing protein